MPVCCVYGCSNKRGKKIGITFHKFPKDDVLRRKWISAVRREEEWEPKPWTLLCSEHFKDSDFDRTSYCGRVRLRENSLPTVFKTFPSYLQMKNKKPRQLNTLQSVQNNKCSEVCVEVSEVSQTPNFTDHSNDLPLDDTPRKKALKRKLEETQSKLCASKKKIKSLLQSRRRLQKRNASLKSIINDLSSKRILNEDRLEILAETMTGAPSDIFNRQVCKASGSALPKTYSKHLRIFALTLHFYSPSAYNYVRKTFNTCLPHPRTLIKWYSVEDATPGFTKESLQFLKQYSTEKRKETKKDEDILCTLIIDEMAIRVHEEFDGKRHYGYVDFGAESGASSGEIAKNVLVFMAVALTGSWKIPVGYFLVNGLTAEAKASLVKKCLCLLSETGVKPISLTFDGPSVNFAMAKKLGCSLDPDKKMQTYFPHPITKEPVYIILDPSHMLKLMRNTLASKGSIYDGTGIIDWTYIVKLHNVQESEGLHLANKLRKQHIEWFKKKMNVRLAAQALSESVGNAMKFCREQKMESFLGSAGTETFIFKVNRLFDIFNSRSFHSKDPNKRPVTSKTYAEIELFLKETENYICNLKTSRDGIKMLQSDHKTGFLGFLINIESFRGICIQYLLPEPSPIGHICTYKFSQDHLEIFFGIVRRKGGCNNNPTARQFTAAYKRILLHNEIKAVETGNCISLDSVIIPSVMHLTSPVDIINSSTPRHKTEETNFSDVDTSSISNFQLNDFLTSHISNAESSDYCSPGKVSELSKQIVAYIAGWVVKTLSNKIKCEKCVSSLRGDINDSENALVNFLSKRKLIAPSQDVLLVCLQCERLFRICRISDIENVSAGSKKWRYTSVCCAVRKFFVGKPIFCELLDHMLDQDPMDNHLINLIKCITEMYLKVRFCYQAKLNAVNVHRNLVRNKLTRTVIFMGQ